ncbi:MAG: hypothetical protein RL213_345 [Bacteroidota bacterium]|jgi:hypothetical protein
MNIHRIHIGLLVVGAMAACQPVEEKKQAPEEVPASANRVSVPAFNADSAFAFVGEQVSFGPRKPNTKAHDACADYLLSKLKSYTPNVIEQKASVTAFDGTILRIRNFIASFNTENPRRILLFAHWDTRPWADQDSVRDREPIAGADDGASGVGVLLEMARQFSIQAPAVGVDIAFFDAEDWGQKGGGMEAQDSYALGTQYWTRQPHVPGYVAEYGILLDMVGARNAQFRLEGNSNYSAPSVNMKIWDAAARLGYSNCFLKEQGGYVTDDHVYVIRYGIPSIDIIGSDPSTASGFGQHWHTHADDLSVIDPQTLKAVGQTLTEVIYGESR